jgi:glycosyltransferase involved in cell wall biosynthesis
VNDEIWKPLTKVATLRMKWELPADHMLFGSFQRDTEGSDLTQPKLEKGPDIFAGVLEYFQRTRRNPYAVLTGWRRDYLTTRLRKAGIGYQPKLIADSPNDLISFEDVNELYNCLDYYLVTSRIEGGPLAIGECAAARVPIVSSNVGMAPDILHPDVIFDIERSKSMWERARSIEVLTYNYNRIRPHLISQGGFDPFRKMFEAL